MVSFDGGFVRQVDDVTASDSRLTVTSARATPQANGYALLWKRYNNNMAATFFSPGAGKRVERFTDKGSDCTSYLSTNKLFC